MPDAKHMIDCMLEGDTDTDQSDDWTELEEIDLRANTIRRNATALVNSITYYSGIVGDETVDAEDRQAWVGYVEAIKEANDRLLQILRS
jgi:hypothetical protein